MSKATWAKRSNLTYGNPKTCPFYGQTVGLQGRPFGVWMKQQLELRIFSKPLDLLSLGSSKVNVLRAALDK
jgi:hypothetical protein